ncbi:MAG: hypothetical protein EU541_01695 [Promethearchaeota archaeon]|nr:MAG: hypothetical protein EU541_01695 [Candidatus Lokiarchaeota archaeon]
MMSYISEEIKKKEKELESVLKIKEMALSGATGFDILFEVEQNYSLTYLFDKFEKSILKDLGNHKILDDSLRSLGNEVLKALNSQISILERDLNYLEYKLNKIPP